MKAALIDHFTTPPTWQDYPEPQPQEDEVLIDVRAAALSQLVRARASGQHYSVRSLPLPQIAGVDGVGTLPDGRPAYFVLARAPYGTMAERAPVRIDHTVALPEGLDPVLAAGLANPGMSSWAALAERARVKPGETVLVNGATGTSGQLAVKVARHMGAARVIATGRNQAVLDSLGADATIGLNASAEDLALRFASCLSEGVDVVLDYLWGPSALALLSTAARLAPHGREMRFVQIGTMAAAEIALPGAVLRSNSISLMGSGFGSVSLPRLLHTIGALFKAAAQEGWTIPLDTLAMEEVHQAWQRPGSDRIVLVR
ncbi:zinc-binding dehydrogenase [Novosphingobium sp. 1949]|uniref:Zinc-binding dehydrogenase n=1 Tax=Novosphingobium organovorum TaxID=2930092 RepID=A0ABT0BB70_9SPHN|nr:zinc-binding dehydrogenase [Novosphingobium organovorum]MCJ2182278.1 zinc-binding dehydrogenase [Novosphingobium organovorum]